jgi:hypothetical protein
LLFFRTFYFSLLLCWFFGAIFQSIISSLLAIMLFLDNSMGTATEQHGVGPSGWTGERLLM